WRRTSIATIWAAACSTHGCRPIRGPWSRTRAPCRASSWPWRLIVLLSVGLRIFLQGQPRRLLEALLIAGPEGVDENGHKHRDEPHQGADLRDRCHLLVGH